MRVFLVSSVKIFERDSQQILIEDSKNSSKE